MNLRQLAHEIENTVTLIGIHRRHFAEALKAGDGAEAHRRASMICNHAESLHNFAGDYTAQTRKESPQEIMAVGVICLCEIPFTGMAKSCPACHPKGKTKAKKGAS